MGSGERGELSICGAERLLGECVCCGGVFAVAELLASRAKRYGDRGLL